MEQSLSKTKSSHVQSVERGLLLVDALAEENREYSLTELAKKMCWPKSTVYGLISTLRDYHYIDQSPVTGRYKLGVRFFEIGNVVARSWNVRSIAIPHMQRLNAQLGEMVQLATEDKGEVLYLDKVDSTQMMRIVSETGGRLPMHCTGLGKALLAYKSQAEVRSVIAQKGMTCMTQKTIHSLSQLEKELGKIRQQGYTINDREIMDNLRCVAAPIFNGNSEVKFAVSVSGLYNNMQSDFLERSIELIKEISRDISYTMGYRGEDIRR